ncbi:hypothetical protein AFLA_009759 [Aspergillus flavus NRRL3357]|nr:hypothetical protein AFLA_009759 [Aspergillus flavus NRRL3357]
MQTVFRAGPHANPTGIGGSAGQLRGSTYQLGGFHGLSQEARSFTPHVHARYIAVSRSDDGVPPLTQRTKCHLC